MAMSPAAAITISILLAATPAAAQVSVGFQGSVDFARFHHSHGGELDFDARTLGGAGAIVEVGLAERLALVLEPKLALKGTRFTLEPGPFGSERVTGSYRLTYLELPALLRLSLASDGLEPYVMAGPTAGWLAAARAHAEAGGISSDKDAKDAFDAVDLGLSLSAGARLPAGRRSLFVEARYTAGLWSVLKDDIRSKVKNRALEIGAGATFFSTTRPAPDPPGHERRGFWIAFAVGHGSAQTRCDRALLETPGGPQELGACEEPGREGGANGALRLGGTLGGRTLLGAEVTSWSGFANPTGIESAARVERTTTLLATVAVYPLAASSAFVKGGIGVALHRPITVDASTTRGLALSTGAGYDIAITSGASLTPSVTYVHAALGDANGPVGPVVLTKLRQDVFDVSLGLTLH